MPVKASTTKKPHKSGRYEYRRVRNGRQHWGDICYYPDGRVVYWAKREIRNLYRKLDSWAVDVPTLAELKLYGVRYVGIVVTDTGDHYLARIQDFTDPDRGAVKLRDSETALDPDYVTKHGDRWQWYLPRAQMAARIRSAEKRSETVMERMRV